MTNEFLNIETLTDLGAECEGAREKFPTNKHSMAALVEEVGELSQALIDHDRGEKSASQVYAEAIQVASMALRVAEEGSDEFDYKYTPQCSKDFRPTLPKDVNGHAVDCHYLANSSYDCTCVFFGRKGGQ